MSHFSRENNRIVWTDTPVIDLDRAVIFYKNVLSINVTTEQYGEVKFAILEHSEGNGGCLVVDAESVTDKGALNYFNVHGRIRDAVQQALKFGGKVLQDVHTIGPHGYRTVIIDSEGNRIALHSEVDA